MDKRNGIPGLIIGENNVLSINLISVRNGLSLMKLQVFTIWILGILEVIPALAWTECKPLASLIVVPFVLD